MLTSNIHCRIVLVSSLIMAITACSGEQSPALPDTTQSQPTEYIAPAPMTKSDVESQGGMPLSTSEIQDLIVGKMITIKHLPTGNELTGYYNEDGTRTLIEFDKGVAIQGGQTTGASRDPYRIEDNQLHATFEGNTISTTIYKLGNRYLALVCNQNGEVNYEVFPPGRKK